MTNVHDKLIIITISTHEIQSNLESNRVERVFVFFKEKNTFEWKEPCKPSKYQ